MSGACALVATADHAELARFLRAPVDTRWSLAYELPEGLAAACAGLGERWQAAIARDGAGRIMGCGFRFVRPVLLAGEQHRLGYLGWLRRDPDLPGIAALHRIRRCMALLRADRRDDELPWDLTAIFDDNQRARRLLERGLPGLPVYRPCGSYRSRLFAARRLARHAAVTVEERSGDDPACRHLVAERWSGLRLAPAAVVADGFLALRTGDRLRACLGWIDERARRRLVVAALPRQLRGLRPLLNPLRHLAGLPRIPAVDEAVACLHLSGCAVDDAADLRLLLAAAARRALERGCDALLAGAGLGTPLDGLLAACGPAHATLARWYAVGADAALDLQPAHQEVASL